MTKLLEKAFSAVAELPDEEQDAMAGVILDELEDERRWDEAFARSSDALGVLAGRALDRLRKGETEPLNPAAL